METTEVVRDLTQGNVTRTMLNFAGPLFFSSLLQTCYNLADMMIVGRFIGREGLAAVAVGSDVMIFLSFVAMGFSNAGQVIVSQYVGAGLREKVTALIGTMLAFLSLCALCLTGAGMLFQASILRWLHTPVEAWDFTRDYTFICMGGLIFVYIYNALSAALRGLGDSRHPFYFIVASTTLNILLDLLFVIRFNLRVVGVALATVISQAVCCALAVTFVYRHGDRIGFGFRRREFIIDRGVLIPFLKLGIPMMLQLASIDFSKLFVNAWINTYGVLATAMTGIGNKVSSVVNVVNISLSTAGSSMIGQCIGGGKYDRVPRIVGVSFVINIAISLVMGAATVFFPQFVFGMFTDDAEVLLLAIRYIPIALLLFAGSALRPPMSSLINGSGNFKLNLLVALLDGVVMRVGLSLLLGLTIGLGVCGFWYGNAFASFTPFVIGGIYFLSGRWRTNKYLLAHRQSREKIISSHHSAKLSQGEKLRSLPLISASRVRNDGLTGQPR